MDEKRYQMLKELGFSDKAINILESAVNFEAMKNPTVTKKHQAPCGDILILSLRIKNDIIEDARYDYLGCAGLQVCASATTEMIKGMQLKQAMKIEIEDIINFLEKIPMKKYECAEASRDTLRMAIQEYLDKN